MSSNDRLGFLVVLQLLLKTAVETGESKSEILQLEFLATGLPRIDLSSLSYPSSLTGKPDWIYSDSVWFDICSLKNLFSEDDVLHNLSDLILTNADQWKSWFLNPQLKTIPNEKDKQFNDLEKLLIIRLLKNDFFEQSLTEYVIEQFHLDKSPMNESQFQGINFITIPLIPVKSTVWGEFLVNKIDFEQFLFNYFQNQNKKIYLIDYELNPSIDDLTDQYNLIFIKNIQPSTIISFLKQIRRQSQLDIVVIKESSMNLNYFGSRLHHYDCLIEGKVMLSNLLYKTKSSDLNEIIGELLENSSMVFDECQHEEFVIVYGIIVIQSILIYYERIFYQSLFVVQWTRNFLKLIVNYLHSNKEKKFVKDLIEISFVSQSPLVNQLIDQLFGQLSSKSTIEFLGCQFEIPQNKSQYNIQWFLSKHKQLRLNFNEFPSKEFLFETQFELFSEKLNKLWHEKSLNSIDQLNISLIYDQIHLLKERLPPLIKLSINQHEFQRDFVSIALFQVTNNL